MLVTVLLVVYLGLNIKELAEHICHVHHSCNVFLGFLRAEMSTLWTYDFFGIIMICFVYYVSYLLTTSARDLHEGANKGGRSTNSGRWWLGNLG